MGLLLGLLKSVSYNQLLILDAVISLSLSPLDLGFMQRFLPSFFLLAEVYQYLHLVMQFFCGKIMGIVDPKIHSLFLKRLTDNASFTPKNLE